MNPSIGRYTEKGRGYMCRRAFTGVVLLAFTGLGNAACGGIADRTPDSTGETEQALGGIPQAHWVGTWSVSPLASDQFFFTPSETFENQTVRQIAHVSIGGLRLRVRISNLFGDAPLEIGTAHVARQSHDASIVPFSDRTLTFDGEPDVSIPAGEEVLSDPVNLLLPAKSNLAISLFFPQSTGQATWHEIGRQTAYVSPPGNFAAATDLPTASTTEARYFLTGVDVQVLRPSFSVVAFGDSITAGFNSTVDANHRYPDFLAERLNPGVAGPVGVLNQGISGNRVLFDFMGTNGADRFDRDVLSQAGAKYLLMLLGINDIGFPGAFPFLPPEQNVPASDIIDGLSDLVARAHAANLIVYGGTLTPFEGTTLPGYFTPQGEAKRQEINEWIRTSGTFDEVIDFDAVLADPEHPTQLLPALDSGDHLHPNDAGYEAMADAIDPGLFF